MGPRNQTRAALAAGLLTLTGVLAGGAALAADGNGASGPSRHRVERAQEAAVDGLADVAAVRSELALAAERQHRAEVAEAVAAEAWNGARWRLQQARIEARRAEREADAAERDLRHQRRGYVDVVSSSLQLSPELGALGALADAGPGDVLETLATVQGARDALDTRYDALATASTKADVARRQADRAGQAAADAEAAARSAHDRAQAAADAATQETASVAARRDELVTRLAELQHTSVTLAARRQRALEERRREKAAQAAAQAAADAAAEAAAQAAAQQQEQQQEEPTESPAPGVPSAPSPPAAPQQASGDAAAAIAFARAQLGEMYEWGAAGPDRWDCSGLTMGAWAAGGIALPHYSVAQYEQTTPISLADLRPGDLLFWGQSSDPSSIYHVALYTGDGMMIQAPRTGRPVVEESMYSWEAPTFFARP